MIKLTIHFTHSPVPSVWVGAPTVTFVREAMTVSTAERYAHYEVRTIDNIEVEEVSE